MNKIIQDMIPTKRKSPLREAIPMERERVKKSDYNNFTPLPIGRRTVEPWLFALIALVCVIALVFAFTNVYARATVTIIPSTSVIPFDGLYTINSQQYKVIQMSDDLSQSISAVTEMTAKTYAKGVVVLYNNYSSTSQKIITGTRLESGNGLIYTTNSNVIIPGTTKNTKGVTIVGSIAVAVTAQSVGVNYNISTSDLTTNPSYGDFTIVAYKGSPKYEGFYARLNPSGAGITGGSLGYKTITSATTTAVVYTAMKQSLLASLVSKIHTLVPDGYILYDNAYSINYNPLVASTTSSTSAIVDMQATISGIMLKKTDIAYAIASTTYNASSSSSFDPQGLESAQFSIMNSQSFSSASDTPLNFSLKGNLDLVGILSTSTLSRQLAGVSLAKSNSILEKYSGIASAHVTMMPFWKQSFPSSPSNINIIIQK